MLGLGLHFTLQLHNLLAVLLHLLFILLDLSLRLGAAEMVRGQRGRCEKQGSARGQVARAAGTQESGNRARLHFTTNELNSLIHILASLLEVLTHQNGADELVHRCLVLHFVEFLFHHFILVQLGD